MPYRMASAGLRKALRGRGVRYDIEVDEVADGCVMLYCVVDVTPPKIDAAAWQVALAVQMMAEALDVFDGMTYRAFMLQFSAAWDMLTVRKREQKETP